MRTNSCNKRDWNNYIKSTQRYNWNFLKFTFVALIFVFSFAFYTSRQILWIIISVCIFLTLLLMDYKLSLISLFLVFVFLVSFHFIYPLININKEINDKLIVNKIINNGIILNYGFNKIFVKTYEHFMIDDLIYIKSSSISKITNNTSFNNFLKSEGVNFIANEAILEKIPIIPTIKQNIYEYFLNGPKFYTKYSSLIILGQKNFNNLEIWNTLKSISIVHLFVVSGFHINFLFLLLSKIIKIKNNKNYLNFIIILLIFPYLWLLGFSLSSVRAFLFHVLIIFNKNYLNNKHDNLNILALSMIIIFLFNPFIIYSLSFIFSFIISYTILLTNKFKHKKWNKLNINLNAWFSSSLLIVYLNQVLNFSGLTNNLIFTPITIFMYFISILFFWLKPVLNNLYLLFDIFINIIETTVISFKLKLNLELIVILYIIFYIYLIIRVKK